MRVPFLLTTARALALRRSASDPRRDGFDRHRTNSLGRLRGVVARVTLLATACLRFCLRAAPALRGRRRFGLGLLLTAPLCPRGRRRRLRLFFHRLPRLLAAAAREILGALL